MRIIICFLFILSAFKATSQDLSFEQITTEPLYAEREGPIYACINEITNHSDDSIRVVYTRIIKDFTHREMINGLCTDIECYYASLDSINETIPPQTIHTVESRWMLTDDEVLSSEGYVEWEIKDVTNNTIIDTIRSQFIYTPRTTSTENTITSNLNLYPNPANDYITISNSDYSELKILNFQGRLVLNLNAPNGTKIDISELQTGPYILIAQIEDKVERMKFIKL